MIINDIVILENRTGVTSLEQKVIDELLNSPKKGRVISGEMFSEVGRYLSPEQFKCLLRWIYTKQNPTIVRRKGVKYPPGWDEDGQEAKSGQVPSQVEPEPPAEQQPKVQPKPKPKSAKPAPKMVAPVKGTKIEDFWPKLGWPNLDAFIKAHPGLVNKAANGVWVIHPQHQYKTYQKESTTIDSEQLIFEMGLYLDNDILLEGWLTELGEIFIKGFARNVNKGVRQTVKQAGLGSDDVASAIAKQGDDGIVIVKSIEKKAIEKFAKTGDANDELIKSAFNRGSNTEKQIIMDETAELATAVQKEVSKQLPKVSDDIAAKTAAKAAETLRMNSGLTFGQWIKIKGQQAIKNTFYAIAKPLALLIPEVGEQMRKAQSEFGKELEKKYKEFQSIQIPGGKNISKCDARAPKIRTILRNHGWLMSSTPTGH